MSMIRKEEQLGFDFGAAAADPPPELPRDPAQRGYLGFEREHREAVARINQRFGTMLEKRVRLKLYVWDKEYRGRLVLNALLLPESRKDEVPLRIGKITFDLRDVEYCFLDEQD